MALGTLFLAGASIDWRAVWSGARGRLVDLPTYPFQRERCWFAARRFGVRQGRETGHPLLGVRLHTALRDVVQFEAEVQADAVPYLRDHRVGGRLILPAAAFVEMALAAAQRASELPQAIDDMVIAEPLVIGDDETRRVQTILRLRDGAPGSFEIASSSIEPVDQAWQVHASGTIVSRETVVPAPQVELTAGRDTTRVTAEMHQAALAGRGLVFGPSLHGVEFIDFGDGEARGAITLPAAADTDTERYLMPPALLDACLQVLAAAIPRGAATQGAYLPLVIDAVRVYRTPGPSVVSRAVVAMPTRRPASTLIGDVTITDANGLVAELRGITLRAVSDPASADASPPPSDIYAIEWEPLDDDASWVPAPAALAERVGPALDTLAREQALADYDRGFVALEALGTQWIVRALGELGWAPTVGEIVDVEALMTRLGIAARYERLLARFLAILAEDGCLRRDAGGFAVVRVPAAGDPASVAAALLDTHSSSRARIELTRRCGAELAGILRGTVDPLQQLFPDGSTELATSLYRDTPEAIVYNQLLRDAVRALAAGLPPRRRVRVLEVGGGTGGTTAWIAPVLDPERSEYLFTDIGASLVRDARERFASHAFMEFATFDLEQDPSQQALGDREFDLILASNVVHATADLRRSLKHLRTLLAPGGILLMLEVTGRERWIDLTFGLTDGWWRFTDTELRGDYPLLSRHGWRDLLTSAGFEACAIGAEHPHSRETVLAARKPLMTAAPRADKWLILADTDGIGEALADRLRRTGRQATLLPRTASDAASHDSIARTVASKAAEGAGIVHLWALDLPSGDETDARSVLPSQDVSLGSLLAVVQGFGRALVCRPGGAASVDWHPRCAGDCTGRGAFGDAIAGMGSGACNRARASRGPGHAYRPGSIGDRRCTGRRAICAARAVRQ